ncbi:tRNA nucleotidyltransferase CCA-adding enzyme protein [Marine Group I thaumarchaeote SCGC AAA799-D11]|uniref:tRNA nucleotidyltransferase CCA-adding enzyme protein n=1 Tax=Marine Group I thaumarchaeote SCGC AAA799-D11 TaxID=1502291 RepID=A0A087RM84_9ARCH|nr:tRNA nucleotidyltransferase CCA-adding enzyme protein [Marine Group I thaumarchaeote SCGC AAA799-D11]
MSIIEFSNKPISIIKNSTISDAIKMLLNTKISRLIVNDGGKHVGIITEKDIGLFLFSETTKRGLEEIPVTEIMRPIEFVDQDVTPKNAAKIMIEKGISSLSIGEEQEVKAIVTKSDLVKYFARRLSDKNKVADVMTHDYESTHTAAPLYKVVRKMLEKKISRIIVKNQQEEPVGIISFRDLFRISIELGSEDDFSGTNFDNVRSGFLSEEGFGDISLARDVMTKGLITIKFNEDLAKACNVMLENNVSGLVVLDGNNTQLILKPYNTSKMMQC